MAAGNPLHLHTPEATVLKATGGPYGTNQIRTGTPLLLLMLKLIPVVPLSVEARIDAAPLHVA